MTREEHETLINFDYASQIVKVYTTRVGVYNQLLNRLGPEVASVCHHGQLNSNAWTIDIPMTYARNPALIVKVMNPNLKVDSSVFASSSDEIAA